MRTTPCRFCVGRSLTTPSLPPVIHVEDAETHFRADEYVDAAASRRPVIYISPNDIYATHSILVETLDVIVRSHRSSHRSHR